MTDYSYTAKGVGVFIVAILVSYVLGFVIPSIVGVMSGEAEQGLVQQLGQYAMILVWVVGCIVLPNYLFYRAINTQNDTAPFIQIIISILMLLFMLLFLFKANYVITAMADILEGGLLLAIYWIGVLTVIGFGFVVTPIATIIQNSVKNQ